MNVAELIALTRQELDDETAPYLWPDDFLLDALVDAEHEACRRGRLLLDSTTAATCQIAVTAGTALYPLDARVIQVNRVIVAGEPMPLCPAMMRDLDGSIGAWQTMQADPPTHWCPDYQANRVLLVGIPQSNGTLNLTVERLPLTDVNDMEDVPEIPARYHRNLRHWMMFRAYSKRDSETFSKEHAADCLALFEREFGPPRPAYDEQWIAQFYQNAWVGRY